MGLFGNSQNGQSLMPSGLGQVANAANQSGLTAMAGQAAMSQVDNMTNGMNNEDQVALIYHLMAAHPNQVALFLLTYPNFMAEFAKLIGLIVRKEMYALFNTGAIGTSEERGGPLRVIAELATDYSSITQENIDMQVSKVVPVQEMQMAVSQSDMRAMQMMGGHQQNMMLQQQQMQQQQMYQQQMMQQQMMQPQRTGMGAALGGFGSSLIRGTLGLPPAQNQMQPGMMPQQPGMAPQQPGMNGF